MPKNLEATLLFANFSKAFDFIHKAKLEQILLTDGFPKVTVSFIMILYKDTKEMVCSFNGGTDFFDIIIETLQRDTLAPYVPQTRQRTNERK